MILFGPQLKGFYRVQTRNKFSGKVTQDTGWYENTLLTSGRNIMADFDFMTHCQVGTDNTAPNVNDTSLQSYHTGTGTIVSALTGQAATPPYYGWKRKVWRFPIGSVAAILKEVGVGWADGSVDPSTLISRALILDPILQTPTTVTPLADEFLEVTYELRYYVPTVDVSGPVVTLAGVAYNTLTRAADATGSQWSGGIGNRIEPTQNNTKWKAWTGDIGTVLTGPSGTGYNCDNSGQYSSGYNANSYELEVNCSVASTAWNAAGGIRSISWETSAGAYQTRFGSVVGDNTIPKSASYSMLMKFWVAWSLLT
jgi:hypothetical protein